MKTPAGVWSDGTRLVVADAGNNRVLIWRTFPSRVGQPADVVLGQATFTTNQPDDPATVTTTAGLRFPSFVDSNGAQLFVADSANNRVLVWDSFPTANGARADVVLGQDSFTAARENDDNQDGAADASPSARTLWRPAGVKLIGRQLFVADSANDRYLVFTGQ